MDTVRIEKKYRKDNNKARRKWNYFYTEYRFLYYLYETGEIDGLTHSNETKAMLNEMEYRFGDEFTEKLHLNW